MKHSLLYSATSRRIFSLSLMLVVLGSSATAFPLFKRKKKAQTTQTEKKSAYERALTEHATESCRGAFVSLHKTDGKILVELPQASLKTPTSCMCVLSRKTAQW